ncbi:RDD family protein [Candidatus Gracilibacteria bacterium]|nr:RDD family protein [Candidatus Gracilibacteria bacterium]
MKQEVENSRLTAPEEELSIPDFTGPSFTDLLDETDSASDLPFRSSAELSSLPESPLESEYIKSFTESATEIRKPLPRDSDESPYAVLKKVDTELDLNFDESALRTPSLDKEVFGETGVAAYEEVLAEKVPTAIFAAVFDAVVAFTLSIVFMVAMMSVIKVDLLGLLLNAETQLLTQLSFVGMYFAVLQLYMVIARSIARKTLGDWAFDIHLAQNSGGTSAIFPFLVIWRSLHISLIQYNQSRNSTIRPNLSFAQNSPGGIIWRTQKHNLRTIFGNFNIIDRRRHTIHAISWLNEPNTINPGFTVYPNQQINRLIRTIPDKDILKV